MIAYSSSYTFVHKYIKHMTILYKFTIMRTQLIRSGMLRPLEKRPVGRWVGKSMPYGGESALAVVTKKSLLPLSTSESPKTKKARASTPRGTMTNATANDNWTTKQHKENETFIIDQPKLRTVAQVWAMSVWINPKWISCFIGVIGDARWYKIKWAIPTTIGRCKHRYKWS